MAPRDCPAPPRRARDPGAVLRTDWRLVLRAAVAKLTRALKKLKGLQTAFDKKLSHPTQTEMTVLHGALHIALMIIGLLRATIFEICNGYGNLPVGFNAKPTKECISWRERSRRQRSRKRRRRPISGATLSKYHIGYVTHG